MQSHRFKAFFFSEGLFLSVLLYLALGPSQLFGAPDPTATEASLAGNTFQRDPGGASVLSATGAQVLRSLEFHFGATTHYLNSSLVVASSADGSTFRRLLAHKVDVDLSLALGLFGWMELGAQMPVTVEQLGRFPGQKMGKTPAQGVGDLSAYVKFQALRQDFAFVNLSVTVLGRAPTATPDAYMGRESLALGGSLQLDHRWNELRGSLSAGYLWVERPVDIFDLKLGDEAFGIVALAYGGENLPWRMGVEAELRTSGRRSFGAANVIGAEARAAFSYRLTHRLGISVGGGVGLLEGIGTATYRGFVALDYFEDGLTDEDGDGVFGINDNCPTEKEDHDDFQDEDGCPEPDNDEDGLLDSEDACPMDPEDVDTYQDDDGCVDPDNDGDGILDEADGCSLEAEDFDGFEDEDGCPENDNDKDGVVDGQDACPFDQEDRDEFQDDDGCPDPDNDGDGLLDDQDQCPLEAEILNGFKDDDGCPDQEYGEQMIDVGKNSIELKAGVVLFRKGRERFADSAKRVLNQVVGAMKNHQRIKKLLIKGYTDKSGSWEMNKRLSVRRCNQVMLYLLKKGIPRERLEAAGYGVRQSKERDHKRRRVEFEIIEEWRGDYSKGGKDAVSREGVDSSPSSGPRDNENQPSAVDARPKLKGSSLNEPPVRDAPASVGTDPEKIERDNPESKSSQAEENSEGAAARSKVEGQDASGVEGESDTQSAPAGDPAAGEDATSGEGAGTEGDSDPIEDAGSAQDEGSQNDSGAQKDAGNKGGESTEIEPAPDEQPGPGPAADRENDSPSDEDSGPDEKSDSGGESGEEKGAEPGDSSEEPSESTTTKEGESDEGAKGDSQP